MGEGYTYGAELNGTWDVTSKWSLTAGYSYLDVNTKIDSASTDVLLLQEEQKAPKHQVSLRSQYYLADNVELTNMAYYVDDINFPDLTGLGLDYHVDDYLRFDTRLAWKPMPGMELSLVGQNLLDDAHPEFNAPLHGVPNEIERAVYGKISLRY
jgi:iron complex outermembrane receptor protein